MRKAVLIREAGPGRWAAPLARPRSPGRSFLWRLVPRASQRPRPLAGVFLWISARRGHIPDEGVRAPLSLEKLLQYLTPFDLRIASGLRYA